MEVGAEAGFAMIFTTWAPNGRPNGNGTHSAPIPRRATERKEAWHGNALGITLLGHVSARSGRLALALAVFVFVGFQMLRSRRLGATRLVRHSTWATSLVALLAGTVDGWLSTGGGVVALYLTWKELAPRDFVAAILVYFLATDLFRIPAYALSGYWTVETLHLYARVAPVALAGYVSGIVLRRTVVSPAIFRTTVLALLTVYGLILLGRVFSD